MAEKSVFKRISDLFANPQTEQQKKISQPINRGYRGGLYHHDLSQRNTGEDILAKAKDEKEKELKIRQLKQERFLSNQWHKAQYELAVDSLLTTNSVKMMYNDVELMDCMPEIGTALDVISEETCVPNMDGYILNINSKSDRIKTILKDLFMNRLQVNMALPMIARSTAKYGNTYMLLNFDVQRGIIGWKQLPVHQIERYENGMEFNVPGGVSIAKGAFDQFQKSGETWFTWLGSTQMTAFKNWQVAHFRLLYDSIMLPYGTSCLHKARRHFRMLTMMEDAMLMYRMDKSVERRVYKINVGAMDPDDVPAYMEDIVNGFKRSIAVDSKTGQLDLKANFISQNSDYFIPFREGYESKIESLPAAQNPTAMDDIKYVQNKVLTAIRVPKAFINFEDGNPGEGKNLSQLDVRFTITIKKIQQSLLMELNKIAQIHLMMLGFTDDLMNFSLTMNNPSTQAEMLEIENMGKKIQVAKDAASDVGGGIPLCSLQWTWKNIMHWSDSEIDENLNNLRLERALATELEATPQIIKRTGIFNKTDNIYGVPNADYQAAQGDGDQGGGPGGGGGGGGLGGGLDFGNDGMAAGAEGEIPMDDAMGANPDAGGGPGAGGPGGPEMPPPNESVENGSKGLLNENQRPRFRKPKPIQEEQIPLFDKNYFINEEMDGMIKSLGEYITENKENETL